MSKEYYDMQTEETSIISYDISVIPNDFNVMTINNLMETGIIKMPAFQRNYVWDRKRASRFIESLILGLPVPQIFLYQKERNQFSVIDGQQRLMTIYFFAKQRFPRNGKRSFLRKVFDPNETSQKNIKMTNTSKNLNFSLQNRRMERCIHLIIKKYSTLEAGQRSALI